MVSGFVLFALTAIGLVFYSIHDTKPIMLEQELGGTIYDEEGFPIAWVKISSPKYQKITETDSKGA